MDQDNETLIDSRGLVRLCYSSTFGNSKANAMRFQDELEKHHFIAPIINVGDYSTEEFSLYRGTLLLFLSTYGDGGAPRDGQEFLEWMLQLPPDNLFANINYAILAFGNSSFENHCGFGCKVEKVMLAQGAKEIHKLTKVDAGKTAEEIEDIYNSWQSALLKKLCEIHPLTKMGKSSLATPYEAALVEIPNFHWEIEAEKHKNVLKEFSNYSSTVKCKVIHLKELRKSVADGRSTLWVRIKNEKIQVTPACNINIFPLNSVAVTPQDCLIVQFKENRGKVPFPPMPFRQIRRIANLRQQASKQQIRSALLLNTVDQKMISEYEAIMKTRDHKKTCLDLVTDLAPRVEFYTTLGLNAVRPYTLASWDPQSQYLDLCVSVLQKGLTSNYLKTYPQFLRITSTPSAFYIPEGRPLIMIGNGSGIAPFRSITQYIQALPAERRSPLRLYYGIQNRDVDYYFKQDWQQSFKEGTIQVFLAESRRDPENKQYVQNLVEKDVEFIHEHLFKRNGVIFICGGTEMAKEINNCIFKAVSLECKVPYKAYTMGQSLRANKTIVEEIFG